MQQSLLWCKIYQLIKGTNSESARYHILCSIIFSSIKHQLDEEFNKFDDETKINFCMNKIEDIEESILSILFNATKLSEEIAKVNVIIDSLSEDLPKNSKGKIHYRKFYPNKIIQAIIDKSSSTANIEGA